MRSVARRARVARVGPAGPEQIRGVLPAIAPIVGTARVASATCNIDDVLAVAIEVAELEAEAEATGHPMSLSV